MAKLRKRGNAWQIDYFDPTGKRVRKSFKKKKEAEAELGKRVSLIAEKRYLDVKKEYPFTLGQLLDKYEENFGDQASYKTWKQYCCVNFKDYFGAETLLSQIHYVDLETYRNHLRKKPTKNGGFRTEASVNREMDCLHHMLSKGVKWDMMQQNPFDKGDKLRTKEENERVRYLTKDEIQRLLSECPKHLKRVVVCAINTGMDRAEILNLKWNQIRDNGTHLHLPKYKTRPPRKVPINDDLKVMFNAIRREQGLQSEYVFTYAPSEDKLISLHPVRKRRKLAPIPMKIKSIKTAFNSAVRRAEIDDFRFKDLRHTFASHAIMRGASLKEVQEILGHKDMKMTMRYAHLSREHKKEAVNRLNGLTAPALPADGTCHKTVTFSDSSVSANS